MRITISSSSAFTLPNALVALSVFMMVMAGVLASHQFGLRMLEITRSRINTTDDSRQAINLLTSEIRSAKIVRVGNGTATAFTPLGPQIFQQGNSLQINLTTNTNDFIRYFRDATDSTLKRVASGSTNVTPIIGSITNIVIFSAQNHAGAILKNRQSHCIIAMRLFFFRLENGLVPLGPTNYFKSYQLNARFAHRALE